MLDTWNEIIGSSFWSIGNGIGTVLPKLVVAFLLFLLGCLIGSLVGRIVAEIIGVMKVDSLLRKANVEEYFTRAGIRLDTGKFIGALVNWFVIIVFLVAALDVLSLTQVTIFLQTVVLLYVPRVIVAVLILLAGVVIGDTLSKIVRGSARAASMTSANLLGSVTKWLIWIFAVLAALFQLDIAAAFVQTLFTGVIVALSLAAGLAFGLGGQKAASEFIDKMKEDISHRGR